jgi:hypothetical protein
MRTVAAAAAALLVVSANGIADDAYSRQFTAVVCVSEASGPWSLKARGTLTRTKRPKGEMAYSFKGSDHGFDWRLVASAEGNTSVQGNGPDRTFLFFASAPRARLEPVGRREALRSKEGAIEELRLVAGAGVGEDGDDSVAWAELPGEADRAGDVDAARAADAETFIFQ